MPGGIQKGQVAIDATAKKIDGDCKHLKDIVYNELKLEFPELTLQTKLLQSQIPGEVGACEPDGGAWFYKGKLIAVFEAKKQQDKGNAIERWFKNFFICTRINPKVSYVTFCIGEGAYEGGVIHKALAVAHPQGFNHLYPCNPSCFMSIKGHNLDFIVYIMKKTIRESIINA